MSNKLAAWLLNVLLLFGIVTTCTVPLTGCSVSASQISLDGQALANALISIADIEATTDPSLATQLTNAANALLQVTKNWQSGSSVADLNDAANAAEAVLALVPATAAIAPLIPIAVAALDVILSDVQSNSNTAAVRVSKNPYSGYHIHHVIMRSPEGDFKAAWNGVVKKHTELAGALIK